MSIQEMHKKFRVYFDKIDSFSAAEYTPEAIDIILNKAQDIVLEELINTGLEKTQTFSDYLSSIIVKRTINTFSTDSESEVNGKYINIPSDYRKFLMDRVVLKVPDCVFSTYIENGVEYIVTEGTVIYNNNIYIKGNIFTGYQGYSTYKGSGKISKVKLVNSKVRPVTRDTYQMDIRNPFKKPSTETVLRLEYKNLFEIIIDDSSVLYQYKIDYIRNPVQMKYCSAYSVPCVPVSDVDCELSLEAQIKIIDVAVQLAKTILLQVPQTKNTNQENNKNNN